MDVAVSRKSKRGLHGHCACAWHAERGLRRTLRWDLAAIAVASVWEVSGHLIWEASNTALYPALHKMIDTGMTRTRLNEYINLLQFSSEAYSVCEAESLRLHLVFVSN